MSNVLTSNVGTQTTARLDTAYREFETGLREDFLRNNKNPRFTTTPETPLMEIYLDNLPKAQRQHYNCNCCRDFLLRYGSIVEINPSGELNPVLFHQDNEPEFIEIASLMRQSVRRGKITGVFLSSLETLGIPSNVPGPGSKYVGQKWTHLHAKNPNVYKSMVVTAEQAMAAKLEDNGMLRRALAKFDLNTVEQAVRILEADAVERSEKALAIAKWFLELKKLPKGRVWNNLVWRAVALAPPGFCNVNSTMIGTLLEDISEGMDFDTVKKRWDKKMHPLQYQRPTTISDGGLEAAEKLVEKLGVARSLERRYARIEDVKALWTPPEANVEEKPVGSVFGHLKKTAQPVEQMKLPTKKMTWNVFKRDILPNVTKLEFKTGSLWELESYFALTTAVHDDAPPILQWDTEEHRNPVAWFFQAGGCSCTRFNFKTNSFVEVKVITDYPSHWSHWFEPGAVKRNQDRHGLLMLLEGGKDINKERVGNALFPETLKSELHGVRKAVEAYSRSAVLHGQEEGNACGIAFDQGKNWSSCNLRATMKDGLVATFNLDRWE